MSHAALEALHRSNVSPIGKNTAANRLFQDDNAYGAALFVAAREYLELDELLAFDPQTIRLELQQLLSIKEIDNEIFGRLMAMIVIVGTDLFYADWQAFVDLCNVLSGQAASPDVFDPADPYEMSWAVVEAALLAPLETGEAFSEEIRGYMGLSLQEHGFFSAPPPLSMAVMPDDLVSPAEMTDDAEIMSAAVTSDLDRHNEITEMLRENLAELAAQMRPFIDITAKD